MKRKLACTLAVAAALSATMLVGCAGQQAATSEGVQGGSSTAAQSEADTSKATFVTPAPADGAISIAVGDLTTSPTYINYDTNGTTVQLIAGLASDGSARVALTTCQVCNPSPKAYFAQDGSKLVCQNCGNKFTLDDVGDAASGCNPTQVEFMESDGVLSVPTSVLDAEAKAFAKWQGPTA